MHSVFNWLIGTLFLISFSKKSFAEINWDSIDIRNYYNETTPRANYFNDPEAKSSYNFGIKSTIRGYSDPSLSEAVKLQNPLQDSRFNSYNIIIVINKKYVPATKERKQTMRVYQRNSSRYGGLIYYWLISTGQSGFETPSGFYTPKTFSSSHYSNQFKVPMRFSVFFKDGKALHSSIDTDSVRDLGKPISHGCVHIEDYRSEEIFHRIGHSGFGKVDLVNEKTGALVTKNGAPVKVDSFKTLIIVK